MSAHNPPANRRPDRTAAEPQPERGDVSTRVLLDSGTRPTCDACGDSIELKAKHKCLTVPDDDGFEEYTFCDDACLARRVDPQ
ncbi:hypothetical protein SAMN05216226_11030 [Halovenus aranensis]|jgi:hypothetical protein|uniref:Uncharacterized protein n=1 Tax=Halovenus aranensis TaxID=890420 RepID=A0A1G8WZA2_9EURY|nr:hypothetical protein [Halovenus aranensis]SDJ83689.1 hypothetical protein SAMN05216226_11030 [Halovenus aranensis]